MQAADSIPFGDHVAAAKAVRRAELGRAAYRTMRPRGVTGLVRSRGPLSVMLYVADREGRLVHGSGSALALLEAPLVDRPPKGGGWRLSVARLLDRHWETAVFALPPALLVGAATACLPFRPLWVVGVILALAALLYVFVFMVGLVFAGLAWLYRTFGRRGRSGSDATEALPAFHWSLRLFHSPQQGGEGALIARVSQVLRALVEARTSALAAQHGAGVDVRILDPLVCLTEGATTTPAREYLKTTGRATALYGGSGGVVLLNPPDRGDERPERVVSTAGFFFWYLSGLIVVLLICAQIVASREGAACAADCAGRPAEYEEAVRWLFGVADDLEPETPGTWLFGPLAMIARWLTLPVLGVAIWQRWRLARHDRKVFQETVQQVRRRPYVLVFVVTQVEYDAVLAAAVAARPEMEAWPDHRKSHTVLRLGEFGGCDVALARSGPGPNSSRGLYLTGSDLVRDLRPDYMVLTGICFGLKEGEVLVGDVVVASQVRDLDHRKFDESRGLVAEQPRGDRIGPTTAIFHHVVALGSLWSRPGPRMHVGPMGGSATLYNSDLRRAEIIAVNPDLLAADMECHAFGAAAVHRRTRWCVVKGVSDLGRDKHDDDQRSAAENAARLLFETLMSGALVDTSSRA